MRRRNRLRRSARRRAVFMVAALLGLVSLVATLTPAPEGHALPIVAGVLPPREPTANFGYPDVFGLACGQRLNESSHCAAADLGQIDWARAAESTGPLRLPTNWFSLSPPEQLFVITDLERVARGLPPFVGMSPVLNAAAQAGADTGVDPTLPAGFPSYGGVSIWAGGAATPLEADWAWMYDDGCGVGPGGGPAGSNLDCGPRASWTAPPSWGHRDAVLTTFQGPSCAACVVGAAVNPSLAGAPSYAEVIVAPEGRVALDFTWARDVRPYLRGTTPGCTSAPRPAAQGYLLLGADGGAFALGAVAFHGSLGARPPTSPVVGVAMAPGGGYWIVDAAGDVFAFGSAHPYGGALASPEMQGQSYRPGEVAAGIAATPTGHGYWIVSPAGDVYTQGDAAYRGSLRGRALGAPIVGIAPTADGQGYWLVSVDGGVFAFGDARYQGSMGGVRLNAPVVGIAADRATGGYWLVASDGGMFSFHAPFFMGSMGGRPIVEGIAGVAPTSSGRGYRLVAWDGGVFDFGDARFEGSTSCLTLSSPVVAIAG